MSDLLCVQSVGKRLQGSTIANVTKVFTAARKSLFVRVNFTPPRVNIGDAGGGLPEPMRWAGISGPRPAGYASNHCLRKKRQSGRIGQ